MNLCVRRARGAIEPGCAAVGFGAGLLTVITSDAQRFVDQQHVRCFTKSLLHKERDQVAGLWRGFHAQVLRKPVFHRVLHAFTQSGLRKQ